ncbi:MAG: hypothetical protein PHZ02_01210 [Desulfocapsaceae bacterium]|nr:hypothetical protein [Desulfocapsaceae bacterium]
MNTVREARFTEEAHIKLDPDQREFLKNQPDGMSNIIRRMVNAYMNKYDKDLAEIEIRLVEIEPEYLALKKKKEELLKERAVREAENRAKDKRVEDAHIKLLELFKNNYNRLDKIPNSYYKVYSDICGVSIDELKSWLEEEVKKKGLIK